MLTLRNKYSNIFTATYFDITQSTYLYDKSNALYVQFFD